METSLIEDCKESTPAYFDQYDIFLIVGQSNTCSGVGLDPNLDTEHPRIKQLGRHDELDFQVIPAKEPLDHHYRVPAAIGFAMTFSRFYVCELLEKERNVLLIPAALSNTGFQDQRWRPGDDLFEDAVLRTNEMLKRYPGSRLKAILWHQGEKDVDNPDYVQQLDTMIFSMRKRIYQQDAEPVPFIVGGMVPFWVDQKRERQLQECRIKETPGRVPNTAYANPRYPCTIRKTDNKVDKIHYDAAGQRELGRRYFEAYMKLQ